MATEISQLLRDLEQELPEDGHGGIDVPPRVIRTAKELRERFAFVQDETLRCNVCYAIEALDFYRWLINRFCLYGPVFGYLVKTGLILIDMVIEALVRDLLVQKQIQPHSKLSQNLKKLVSAGVPQELRESSEALHSRRANVHLHLVTDRENAKYTMKDWNRSVTCLWEAEAVFRQLLTGE